METSSENHGTNEISELRKAVETLTAKVADLQKKTVTRVQWEDKVSESGIKLEGASTIKRKGTVISSFGVPMSPTQMAVLLVVKRDQDNKVLVLDVGQTTILAE